MSIVTISEIVGSLGSEIGRAVAAKLGYEFADREIITKAAERFGESVPELTHAVEDRPTLWERFRHGQHRYVAYVEATILEMAAHDNVVLVGHASTIVLGQAPHTVRVRVCAPEHLRSERVRQTLGLTTEAAFDYVRDIDHERAARVRFLYQANVDDPLLYDLVLNTDRVTAAAAARLVEETLRDERFRATAASCAVLADRSLIAQARAALFANPLTRDRALTIEGAGGVIALRGRVASAEARRSAEETVKAIAGVGHVINQLAAAGTGSIQETDESHGQFRHGEERSWGGYGGGGYDRDRPRKP